LVCIAIAGLEHRQKQIVTRKKVKNSPTRSFVWLPAKELCFFQQMEQVSSVISLELRGSFPSGICAYQTGCGAIWHLCLPNWVWRGVSVCFGLCMIHFSSTNTMIRSSPACSSKKDGSLYFVIIWFDNTAFRVSVSNLLPGPKDQVSDTVTA